uniref:secretin N-terminal domain-containing protein n=1 Tax=Serratia quinivorans TaxID=137545 RepID=UPI0035C6EF82
MTMNRTFTPRRRAALLLSCALCLPTVAWAERHDSYSASFNNTDIHEFINTISKNLNKTVIIDPAVKGNISVRSYEELDDQQYYQLFLSVLEVYGFTVVDMQNGVLKVLPAKGAKGAAIPLLSDERPAAGDEVVMRLVPLHNVTAKELAPLLQQLNDAAVGSVVHYDPSNVLLITGRAAVVNQLMAIVENVDRAGDHGVETLKLEHASAAEVARMITSLNKDEGKAPGGRPKAGIVADERTNSVLISGEETARRRMIETILQLDDEGEARGNTRVIYLKYAKAQSLLEVLNGVATLDQALINDESGAHILPLAKSAYTPRDVLGSAAMHRLLQELRNRYEIVLLDTAPLLAIADTRILAPHADAVVMLVRWKKTPVKAVQSALALLQGTRAFIAGVALTQMDLKAQSRYGY